jgi:hypothetical protein
MLLWRSRRVDWKWLKEWRVYSTKSHNYYVHGYFLSHYNFNTFGIPFEASGSEHNSPVDSVSGASSQMGNGKEGNPKPEKKLNVVPASALGKRTSTWIRQSATVDHYQ